MHSRLSAKYYMTDYVCFYVLILLNVEREHCDSRLSLGLVTAKYPVMTCALIP